MYILWIYIVIKPKQENVDIIIVCGYKSFMGYPTKIQLISRDKGNQWYVNFPNALAMALDFKKGETVEWEIDSIRKLIMLRKVTAKMRTPRKPKTKRA